ncbi:MAG: triose-phosphate isomerase [Desulfobulbaceae bacterium]|nr:triose-phosphate isomerase [Desulfobulbaceae bacterium]
MEKVILANWKGWIGPGNTDHWFDIFLKHYRPVDGLEVVVATGFVQMARAAARLQGHEGITICAQVVSPYPPGGYTGEVPAQWLKGLAEYVLVGHREREKYFHEDDLHVARQVSEARHAGLTPIICMDRKGARRRLAVINDDDQRGSLLAYTPSEADALENVDEEREINESVELISVLSGGGKVLYGGGVDRNNAARLISLPGVAGLMAGRGCLDPLEFAELVANVAPCI